MLKVTVLGKGGEEGIENYPSVLPGLGPTEEARLSPAPHPLVPVGLTLGSATPAMVAWAWGVGRGRQTTGAGRRMGELSKKERKKE